MVRLTDALQAAFPALASPALPSWQEVLSLSTGTAKPAPAKRAMVMIVKNCMLDVSWSCIVVD